MCMKECTLRIEEICIGGDTRHPQSVCKPLTIKRLEKNSAHIKAPQKGQGAPLLLEGELHCADASSGNHQHGATGRVAIVVSVVNVSNHTLVDVTTTTQVGHSLLANQAFGVATGESEDAFLLALTNLERCIVVTSLDGTD